MNRVIISIVMIVIITLNLTALTVQISNAETNPVPLDTIKQEVQEAYNYILNLIRYDGEYAVISEYPSVPIVVTDNNRWYWIPGLKISADIVNVTYVEIRDPTIDTSDELTIYRWYMDLVIMGVHNYRFYVATLWVREFRGSTNGILIEVDSYREEFLNLLESCHIYVAGNDLGVFDPDTLYYYIFSDNPIPSMRTSVRHVDMIGELTLSALDTTYWASKLYSLDKDILHELFGYNKEIYDIYNPMFKGLGYTGEVEEPNGWHFYDAQWFGGELGYTKIWDFINNQGWIKRPYPIYPYKSKVVAFAEETHVMGGDWFLAMQAVLNDPLYHGWWGLYYAYQGDYDRALEEWNSIVSAWDGTGIYVNNQVGYSTVRLAVAVALGSILADEGYISWNIVHEMVNVLVQLQWQGSGHYSPDGSSVIYIHKPDHKGGFMVSYGSIGSYGIVPFRSPFWESIIDFFLQAAEMGKEYGGVIPTNTETTLLSMVALMQYAYHYYGVTPPDLLNNDDGDWPPGGGWTPEGSEPLIIGSDLLIVSDTNK